MALTRVQIQERLENILGAGGHVYYQPPTNIRISYPAIIFRLENINQRFADDCMYNKDRAYLVTLVHPDPDNDVIERLLWAFPKIRFDRAYDSDNLHHYVYVLYE